MNRYTEEMKIWLFDLAHGNLKRSDIIAGFIRHYVLHDCTLQDVKRDMVFHTNYGQDGLVVALDSLTAALESLATSGNM